MYPALHQRLQAQLTFLPDKPEETAESTARALWFAAAGMPRSAELSLLGELPELDERQRALLDELVSRRIGGVPLAHLSERQRFMGMEMLAGSDALVPRKETELLGQTAVRLAQEAASASGAATVIDVCTGSGNVALAVAHHVPTARVFAADISEGAVALARRNASHLGLHGRVEFRCGDLLAPLTGPELLGNVDVLTCNPPYINSAKVERMPTEISAHEPRLAFDGGALGISVLMRFLQQAPQFLRSGGWLAFEVGLGQGPALVKRMTATPAFKEVATCADAHGAIRVVYARC